MGMIQYVYYYSILLRPEGSGPRLLSQPVPTVPAM
jgi:hypothetical protein